MKDKIIEWLYTNINKAAFTYLVIISCSITFVCSGNAMKVLLRLHTLGFSNNEILFAFSIMIPFLFYCVHKFINYNKYKTMFGIYWLKPKLCTDIDTLAVGA
jgi:hypothetical protein